MMKRRVPQERAAGKVGFDERGNAVFEWSDKVKGSPIESTAGRLRALQNTTLAIVDDEPAAGGGVKVNAKGLRQGYNPYESGMLPKDRWKPKKDLRELSRWIEARKTADHKR